MLDSELLVRAKEGDQIYELIPQDKLGDDFPDIFREEFVHWQNTKNMEIEFRPLTDAWTCNEDNWRLRKSKNQTYYMSQGSKRIIDCYSKTASILFKVFAPLESHKNVHLVFDESTKTVEISLPRLKLDFFKTLNGPGLESRQFRGMIIEEDQRIGTMTGLKNRLVMKGGGPFRRLIIPDGDVLYTSANDHLQVTIRSENRHCSYHSYLLDSELGRMIDSTSLKSKLFRCYLHALTSGCLVDKLTGRTGTEEALSILTSPATLSFRTLSDDDIKILDLISELTPNRSFYPEHKRVMQDISWKPLSPLSQHPDFVQRINNMKLQSQNFSSTFHWPGVKPSFDSRGDEFLRKRAAIRDSVYRTSGFGAEASELGQDCVYDARDYGHASNRETRVLTIARLVDTWSTGECSDSLMQTFESWMSPICGCMEELSDLGYDEKWLKPLVDILPAQWLTLQAKLYHCNKQEDKYRIMFFLCTLAFSKHANMRLTQTLLTFATISNDLPAQFPSHNLYNLSDGYGPEESKILGLVKQNALSFSQSPGANQPPLENETWAEAYDRREKHFQEAVTDKSKRFTKAVPLLWPRLDIPIRDDQNFAAHINIASAIEQIRPLFQSWYRNKHFQAFTDEIQIRLNGVRRCHQEDTYLEPPRQHHVSVRKQGFVTMDHLFAGRAPQCERVKLCAEGFVSYEDSSPGQPSNLEGLLSKITSRPVIGYERAYFEDLAQSRDALEGETPPSLRYSEDLSQAIRKYYQDCSKQAREVHKQVIHCLKLRTPWGRKIARKARSYPRLSTTILLQSLARCPSGIPFAWKRALVMYATCLADLQRSRRLLRSSETQDRRMLLDGLLAITSSSWDPYEYPAWLVFEIENDISIRPVQSRVAQEIISPVTKSNSVLQLNMGEGKSSVIVPISASVLADGSKLVRISVLKPLSQQMLHLLVQKLGGLLGRRIFHLPISRSISVDMEKAQEIRSTCQQCLREGGILLIQPEHIQSFELLGVERILSGEVQLGEHLIETQLWLDENSRDIMDESDEILNVRSELVYTMGMQSLIDFSPFRWLIIQEILSIVKNYVDEVYQDWPPGLELKKSYRGSFPHIRILQQKAGQELMAEIASKICKEGLPGFPVWNRLDESRACIFQYLTGQGSDATGSDPPEEIFHDQFFRHNLLILKGLICDGILIFALQRKRWRVNYGLDISRSMLAVPYQAKDCPTPRAEFSHPDATIVLTCLTYYYGGLSNEQLILAFERLLSSENAQEEFDMWIRDAKDLPITNRNVLSIDLSDINHCSEHIFPALKFAKCVIDFYLAQIVFPTAMKECQYKFSLSGWDLARHKSHMTTGFSGTNDSKYLLPLSMKQGDLASQQSTNARVMQWLLQPENTFEHILGNSNEKILTARALLDCVLRSDPPIRVIIDVGAQVLEWQNEDVARRWLSQVALEEAQAVVFFNKENELSVLDRDGVVKPIALSPFASQMDQCLIYLDEAHTRGTDLQLPLHYRALVPLGPQLTKDRLVQGRTPRIFFQDAFVNKKQRV